jgi:hypothetical protein
MTDITPLPTPPSTSDPVNFAPRADAFLGAFPTFADEMNAYGGKLNSFSTNSTSTTSLAIGTGSKSLTVTTGKSYVTGMYIRVVSTSTPTNYMQGTVVSYNSGTGALVFTSEIVGGSGTIASWTISMTVNPADRPAGTVLQVVQGTFTSNFSTTSASFVDTGITATITPVSTSSKILALVSFLAEGYSSGTRFFAQYALLRGSTVLTKRELALNLSGVSGTAMETAVNINWLDSPASASAVTYKVQALADAGNSATAAVYGAGGFDASIVLVEIAG